MAQTDLNKYMTAANDGFAGSGEMAVRIRETDWSKTPLGAVESWQQSLKTTVRIMLNSRYPMFVWWGKELVNLYNDAYAPILGKRHPQALGKSANETWTDIWDVVGRQADLVINEGSSTWNEEVLLVMERNDFREETYFTFSYSPITDDLGRIGGLFCVCTEDTAKVVGRRRLQTLSELGERAAEVETAEEVCAIAAQTLAKNRADLPFAAVYLLDENNRHAQLQEAIRLEKGSAPAPLSIACGAASDVWNFGQILQTGKSLIVENIGEKFGALPAGTLDEPPQRAIVLPLARAGTTDSLAGFLVAAISPNLTFEDDYRSFTELVAGHLAAALANARALEEERKRAAALAELDRAKTEFFSNVSHEFRTPLTLTLGNLEEVLRRDDALPESEREQLETAHRNSLRLLKLVNNLLDFSRLEAGKADAQFEPTDLARLTGELASNFRAGIEKAGLKLIVDCPPLAEPISVDREMWEKIVLNLLSNAFKFTLHGEIEIALEESGESVVLKVRDTGVGIPAHELPNIFQRFHRVRAAGGRTHEGTGIGLSLVQELVRLHQGTIEVTSEVERGTTFRIVIPKFGREEEEKTKRGERKNAPAKKIRSDWKSYVPDLADGNPLETDGELVDDARLPFYPSAKVLLADDNADMRGYISRLLVQNGFRVETAVDGREALEKLQSAGENLPDLILTDVMMPRMDGFQLLDEIRRDELMRAVPVIMLSARAGEESKIEGFEAGADDYLIKPFSARELLARVGSVIELAKMRRAFETEKEKFFAVLESVTDACYALDRDFRFAFLNDRAEQYFGLSREVLIGRHALEVFPKGIGTLFQTEFERAFGENVPVEFEILSPLSNRWIEIHAYPSRNWLLVYFRDITERKEIQEALAETADSLWRERERLNIALLTGSLGVYEWRIGAETIWWSPEVYPLYGVEPESFVPTREAFNALIHPEDREELWRKSEECIREIKSFNHEYRIIRPDGAVRWIHNMSRVILNSEGSAAGITGVASDITERKRAEELLRESEELFRLFVTTGSDAIYKMSADWSRMLNLQGRNLIEDTTAPTWSWLDKYVFREDQPLVRAAIDEAVKNKSVFELEHRVIRPDGSFGWTFSRAVPVLDERGELIEWFGAATDVTDRKLAQEALLKSEAEFRELANAVPQIVWVADADGKVVYLNNQWTEYSGLSLSETLDREKVVSIYHPDDAQYIFEAWSRARDTGTPFEVEGRLRNHRTNEFRWFLMRSEPTRDANGKILKWFGTSTDITAGKQAENRAVLMAEISRLARELENPSELLHAVSRALGEHFEARRCLFNEINLEGDTEIVHRDYCRGVPSVAGKHKISVYSSVTTAEMTAGKTIVNKDSKTDPRTAQFYEQTYAPSGERAYVAVPLLRENRWVASLWISTDEPREWSREEVSLLEFIAEQIWAVIEKLRIDAALRESEQRFRNMADHAPVMIWVTETTGYCNYLSQSWYEFTGQTPETGLGFGWVDATHPDDAARAEREFIAANAQGAPFKIEYRLRRKDGSYAWAIDSAQPRFGENGEFLGYIGSVIDITERKLAEQEREKLLAQEKLLREEAERANRLKDEFLATVSHELRTPLNSILGWASTVRQQAFNPDVMRRAFEIIERNARNQNQIISDILDVSRIITGKLNLNLQPVELPAAILAAIDTVRPALDAKGIRLETDLEPAGEIIVGDADRLQQIVWNMLSNAVKFTPDGGRIEISLRNRGDCAEIRVADNGIGIEPEFLPFVFDRFRQADGRMNRRHGGLGLGLAIVRHLAELHGGSVSAESEGAGKGAAFTVRFPLKPRSDGAGQNGSDDFENDARNENAAANAPRRLLEGLKILVVDDEPDALELTAFILANQSAEVLTAGSADEALKILETEKPDAIVSDIGMPEKDGLDLICEIRARTNFVNSPIPTIALTAYAREEDSRRVLEAGFDEYLPKPVEPTKLIEIILKIAYKAKS